MTDFMHTHPHILLTRAEVHMHAQVARGPQWGMREVGEVAGQEYGINWKQDPENLSAAGQARIKIKGRTQNKCRMLREDWIDEEGKMQGKFWESSLRRGFSLLGTQMGRGPVTRAIY